MSAFDRLIGQIDSFIRKYYKNQIIKGVFLFVGVLLVTYLCVVGLEYFGRFNSLIRGILLFGFIGVNGYILARYIFIPLLKLKAYGTRIDRYQASAVIGKFFPDVSDRLLNTLQLNDQISKNSADFELLNASVQQRSEKMSVLPFSEAIDLGENRKHLKWLIPVFGVLFIMLIFMPSLFTQGTNRVLNFTQEFELQAPFTFSLLGDNRKVVEGSDFSFEVELSGNDLPEKLYVNSPKGRKLLKRKTKNTFVGEIAQVRKRMIVQFEANEYRSEEYNIEVIAKTAIGKMQATLKFPEYLKTESEVVENASDLIVPEGTEITWSVLTKNSVNTEFWLGNERRKYDKKGFSFVGDLFSDVEGGVVLENTESGILDTTSFKIDVIKDSYPSISVQESMDSLNDGRRFFNGMVSDDHGLSSLVFVYKIVGNSGRDRVVRMNAGHVFGTEAPFDFAVDFRRENISLEDKIEYYFIVGDNDGVNGSKTVRSRVFLYKLPNLEELNDKREEEQEKTKDDLSNVLKQADKFKENLERLREETRNSKQSNWNKENQVRQLKEDHKSLLENLESIQEEMQNSLEEKNQLSEIEKEIMDQQELIDKLLEELMDDELKDLLDQLEDLLKQNDEEGIQEKMDELEMSSEDMKKQLDRSLEMLKRLQVNEKIDDIEEELKELSKDQEELREKTENEKNIDESDKEKQNDINERFEDLKKELEELDELNNQLNDPMDLKGQEEQSKEISEDLKESSEQLDKNKGKKASGSQKSASEKMKQMAENLDMQQQQANQEQQGEDMDMLRNVLESLVSLSLDQEDVMNSLKKTKEDNPAFKAHRRNQRRIVNDTRNVRDSLYALAERQPKIASFIDKELNTIEANHKLALEDLDEFFGANARRDNRKGNLAVRQQYVMTSYNNLALMLNESLQDMQQKMKDSKPGSGSCNKPGGNGSPKPGAGKMSSQDMKQMLKKQLDALKKGSNAGGSKPGDKPGSKPGGKPGGEGGMGLGNKQIAKMAAEQSAIRKRLEQLKNELNKSGKGEGNRLNPLIDELEKQEKDLVNKRLNNNLIKRQQEILTRLLESEKAIMERGYDEKRESKEGKNENNGNLIRFNEYNKEKLKQIELLRSVDPAYRKYYKDRANEYFNRM
ncbi:MAG: hypothetical protein MK066_00325 [Crocinitomicaceae bacterium]|nr:hypothetical protein [Crocinitomicaceae bacterium]